MARAMMACNIGQTTRHALRKMHRSFLARLPEGTADLCAFTTNSAKARARAIRSRCMLRITLLANRRVDVTRVHWRRMLKYFYYSAIALSPSQRPAGRPGPVIRLVLEHRLFSNQREQLRRGGLADRFRIKFASNLSLAKTRCRFHRNPRYYIHVI